MDEYTFDAIVRSLGAGATRRRLASLLGGSLAGGALLTLAGEDAEGKKHRKKKKPCAPCRVRRKGKCKGVAPDGAACGTGQTCQAGACVASCPEGKACGNGGTCKNGQCVVPATCTPACELPETCVNGACSCPTAQTCGDVCCEDPVECQDEYCKCSTQFNYCSCPAGDNLCVVDELQQCCLADDTCDPVNACVTDTCSADNTFCTPEWAFCNGSDQCSCASTVTGDTACVDSTFLTYCPDTSDCINDADCNAGQVCVNPCCPEGDIRSVCMDECPAGRNAAARSADRHGKSAKLRAFGKH